MLICSLLSFLSRPLCVNLHLIGLFRNLVNTDEIAQLLLANNLLVQYRRGALPEHVTLELGNALVRLDVVALQGGLLGCDDGHVDVASRAEIVEDTGQDSLAAEVNGLLLVQLPLPLRLEDRHGGQRARAHGHVRQLVGGAVRVHREEVGACGIDSRDDQVGPDVALVAEEVLLEHGHACDDARFAASGEGVQFELGADQGGCELGVGGRAGAGAPDVGRNVVELLAVLVGDDRSRGCSCIGGDLEVKSANRLRFVGTMGGKGRERKSAETHHYTAVKYTSNNGCSCASRLGQCHAPGM